MKNVLLLLLMLATLWGRLWVGSDRTECCCGEECCCMRMAAQAEHSAPAEPACPCDCGEKDGAHFELLLLAWENMPVAQVSTTRTPVPPVAYRELTAEESICLHLSRGAVPYAPPRGESCALPALYAGFDSPLRA